MVVTALFPLRGAPLPFPHFSLCVVWLGLPWCFSACPEMMPWLEMGVWARPAKAFLCPPRLPSLAQEALQGVRCSQSQCLEGNRRGPDLVLQGGTPAHPSTSLCGVRAHALVSTGGPPPAGAGGAVGCMHVCAESHARCSVHARLCALCGTRAQTSRGVIHGTMERRNSVVLCSCLKGRMSGLSALGLVLPAWAGSSWAHIHLPVLPSAESSSSQPPLRGPLALCALGGPAG